MADDKTNNTSSAEIPVQSDEDSEENPVSVVLRTDATDVDEGETLAIPRELPILPLRDSVVFPGTVMPLKVVRERVQRVLDAALAGSRIVCAVSQRHERVDQPSLDDLHRVGTACAILKLIQLEDGSETIIVQGIARVGIVGLSKLTPFLLAEVKPRQDSFESSTEMDASMHSLRASARRAIELSPNVGREASDVVDSISSPGGLADFLAANLALSVVQKQELLETFDVRDRLRKVNKAVARQIEVLEISQKIQEQVRGQMEKSQREYYLREQLKAIQSELGQADIRSSEIAKFKDRIAEAKMPEAVAEQAHHELDRLEAIPQASPEYSTTVDYLDWLTSLPWSVSSKDRLDIKRASKILDQDHYGLRKVKKRILEFLAVRQLKPDGRGPILCFAGPPGVGKTSLGQSIARALDRKFIRISLGGAHDEADIRGHRRTYIGALPGRIIQELRKTGFNNPVFMLDEVDKLGMDFRGDPASALLEVLDPAQNSTFMDRYLDAPFDLSNVMFIATANYMEAIPTPLRDRMEVIELSGYTHREKLEIAKKYLVPRQIDQNGLADKKVSFDEEALRAIIAGYTREAGVRGLERMIGTVCRARAAAIVGGSRRSNRITARSLSKDLGAVRYESEVAARKAGPGVVTGLAFTPVGGEILFVEARRMPGRGQLNLTGQIGEVMRESAHAAFSIIRSRADTWHIDQKLLSDGDFHIHVPAGAIPKDGPSAGVAMFTALVSLLSSLSVDSATGMTGEITLRGAVLPVGGVRDKVLAAHRAGLKRVILPKRNLRDLDELPEDVRKEIEFVPVTTLTQLLKAVFRDEWEVKDSSSDGSKAGRTKNGNRAAAARA